MFGQCQVKQLTQGSVTHGIRSRIHQKDYQTCRQCWTKETQVYMSNQVNAEDIHSQISRQDYQ